MGGRNRWVIVMMEVRNGRKWDGRNGRKEMGRKEWKKGGWGWKE